MGGVVDRRKMGRRQRMVELVLMLLMEGGWGGRAAVASDFEIREALFEEVSRCAAQGQSLSALID